MIPSIYLFIGVLAILVFFILYFGTGTKDGDAVLAMLSMILAGLLFGESYNLRAVAGSELIQVLDGWECFVLSLVWALDFFLSLLMFWYFAFKQVEDIVL